MNHNIFGHFYKVNGKIFYHKIEAILEANKTKSEVTWHFYDDIFKSYDWTKEPDFSLDDFYYRRALQIREKYDYVVILCSGGADSTNVVKSFLNNNIFPDEIIASAPLEGLNSYEFTTANSNHSNTMSETKFAQLPLIDEIKQKYPNIKVTLHDYFKDMIDYQPEEWLHLCEDWVHPSSLARYRFERIKHLKNLAESGKRIAFVYGIDKPVLILGSGNKSILSVVSDLTVNVQRPPFDVNYPNVDNVLFYWTPDLIPMMIKQAHQVAKWIFLPENKKALRYFGIYDRIMKTSFIENRMRHSKYERAIVPCIYPSTHRVVFQAEKPASIFLGEHDDWFYKLHNKTILYQMMVQDSFRFLKKIDPMYLNKQRSGLITYSKYYNIGDITNFCKDINLVNSLTDVPEILASHYLGI